MQDACVVDTDPVIGMTLSGYRVERLMGVGGMGLVYLARHEFIDRRFAVKALKPDVAADAAMARNFLREAQVLSVLKHPNIVDIVSFGALPDGRHYMVMEFLEGRTLEDELIQQGRVSPERALVLADQVLLALEAAHDAGVIHRDLKPSNVFLNRASGSVEVVKLLDFGLARQQPIALAGLQGEEGKTVIAGTPDYISPEQALGHAPTPACDVYSFGVMLFELLAGFRPFDPPQTAEDRTTALLHAHLQVTPPTLKELGVVVPDAMSELVAQCLKKNPDDRPRSAAELRAMLSAFRPATPAGPLALPTPTKLVEPIVLEKAIERDLEAAVQRRSWKGPVAILAAVIALLLAVVFWPDAPVEPPPAPVTPVAEVTPPPAPAPSPSPAPVVEAPKPAPDDLAALPDIAAKPAPKKLVVATPPPTERTVIAVEQSDCEPDDRWRAASRVHLQELQSLAADDEARWKEFERVEPSLSQAITNAATGAQCDAVDRQIRKLAIKWKK